MIPDLLARSDAALADVPVDREVARRTPVHHAARSLRVPLLLEFRVRVQGFEEIVGVYVGLARPRAERASPLARRRSS